MKKIVGILSLMVLLFAVGTAQAEEVKRSVNMNGYDWNATPHNEKLAFIEGINYSVAIEFEIEKIMQKESKPSIISPFEQAWLNKFAAYSTSQIVQEIDKFYVDNPDKMNLSLGRVIWYELIRPGK